MQMIQFFCVCPDLGWYYLPFIPKQAENILIGPQSNQVNKIEHSSKQKQKKLQIYYEIYQQQLMKMRQSASKKHWSQEEDQILLNIDPLQANWQQIARNIVGTNEAICRRRYARLHQQLVKWPKAVDEFILKKYGEQNKSWGEIKNWINENICKELKLPKFTTNKIKQRYMLYLKPGISRRQWGIKQDLQIIKLIKQNGKQWVKLIKQSQILESRTQLQVKNRYFGTLKFLQKKVIRRATSVMKCL